MSYSEKELNRIAGQAKSKIGFITRQGIYNAFRQAGLSPEKAKSETLSRLPLMDELDCEFEEPE